MNIIYWILGLPHIICYMIYRHIIKEIDEDLATYTSGRVGVNALIFALRRKEYRKPFLECLIVKYNVKISEVE